MVSLPNTYPKSLPSLDLSFGPGVPSKAKMEAQEIVQRKPRTLLGSEMIFEIATALQDLLDNIVRTAEAPSLEEERMIQLAAAQKSKPDHQMDKLGPHPETEHELDAAKTDDDETLRIMMMQAKVREERRKAKPPSKPDAAELEAQEGLQFDHPITVKDAEGSPVEFDIVHQSVRFRQGPVTKVSKVHIWNAPKHLEPCLILKECRFPTQGMGDRLKAQIFELDQKLDQMVQLPANMNVIKPLGFVLRRVESHDRDPGLWYVAILMELAPQGPMQDLLEIVHVLDVHPMKAWALQLLEGLMFYHRHGIIHASIHLRNILLVKADTGDTVVKLADASYQHSMHVLKRGLNDDYSMSASTSWMPPEIVNSNGNKRVAASDIWDLGSAFVHMLFGLKVQSVHHSPRNLIHDLALSISFGELLDQIFKPDHRKRPSAFELLPSTFFRNNDPILSEPQSSNPPDAEMAARRKPADTPRWRRESTTTPSISRYKNDFIEAGRLGRGGYGEVVRARNKLDGRFYAIKLIKSHSTSALNVVLSEIMLLSQLNHPNVVRYFNAWLESEEVRTDGREDSQSSATSSYEENDMDRSIIENSPSGLDFMSESGPDLVFESESDDEVPMLTTTLQHGVYAGHEVTLEKDVAAVNESGEEDDTKADSERASGLANGWVEQRTSSDISQPRTTIFIQMEMCDRKVCPHYPVFVSH